MKIYNCHTIDSNKIKQDLQKKYGIQLTNHLWYQPQEKIYFTLDWTKSINHLNCVFRLTSQQFAKQYQGQLEFYHSSNPLISKFVYKKVLILGGGPSTDVINWDIKDYDYIISCNNFYMNDKLFNIKIDFLHLNVRHAYPEPQRLFDYLDRHNPLVVCHGLQMAKKENFDNTSTIKYLTNYSNKIDAELRFGGRIGVVASLILYMCFWKAAEIHIVGLDGIATPGINHGFTHHACKPGTIERHYSKDWNSVINSYYRRYILLFDYILHYLDKKPKFKNLSEDLSYNLLSGLSKAIF